jgi:hypothetical protein
MVVAIIAIIVWMLFYRHYREPILLVPITWMVNLIGYSIFKAIVKSDLRWYDWSVIWSNIVLLHALGLLIAAVYIFKDTKKWTIR